MKNRKELAVIAANLSDDVVTLHCTFALQDKTHDKSGRLYTYKAPRDLADRLVAGALVLVEGPDGTPSKVVRVVHKDDECILEDASISYKWVFARVDDARLQELKAWESSVVEKLYAAQRRRAKEAMLQEIGADAIFVPRITAAATDSVVE